MSKVPAQTRSPAAPLLGEVRLEVCTELSQVSSEQWNRLLSSDDAPLLSWEYLQALEESGCVGEATGWLPAHLLLRRCRGPQTGELVAAAPAYIKTNSDGEWVYDYDWAEFAQGHGLSYYPKLVLAVPFNPVTGGRLLTRLDLASEERRALRAGLLQAARTVCQRAGLSSAHVLFPRGPGFADRPAAVSEAASTAELHPQPVTASGHAAAASGGTAELSPETADMPAAGFMLRRQEQYHFHNDGYHSFDDFLARLRSHRRAAIKRERRELAAAGVTVRSHRGLDTADGFTRAELARVFAMYVGTSHRYTGGPPFLNERCFNLCAERLGRRLELVLARDRRGEIIGGAWNLRGDRRLYGRYWGRALDAGSPDDQDHAGREPLVDLTEAGIAGTGPVPFLHFEVCYYHAVERCISEGLSAFEPGHGGDQKLVRGFTPSYTYSAHYLADPRLRLPIEAFLRYESPLVEKSLQEAALRSNLRAVPTIEKMLSGKKTPPKK